MRHLERARESDGCWSEKEKKTTARDGWLSSRSTLGRVRANGSFPMNCSEFFYSMGHFVLIEPGKSTFPSDRGRRCLLFDLDFFELFDLSLGLDVEVCSLLQLVSLSLDSMFGLAQRIDFSKPFD